MNDDKQHDPKLDGERMFKEVNKLFYFPLPRKNLHHADAGKAGPSKASPFKQSRPQRAGRPIRPKKSSGWESGSY